MIKKETGKVSVSSFGLEEKAKLREQGYSRSQQEILARIKANKASGLSGKITESLQIAMFSEDEEGNTLADVIASKVASGIKDKAVITVKEANDIRAMLGENSTSLKVDANVNGKVDIKAELAKLASEEEF